MHPIEHAERAAQREADHQRWADDGGPTPAAEMHEAVVVARPPWLALGVAVAVGLVIGWLTAPPHRGR
jgi:ElaB/YqjD/DUF883 family membrane-anchored ribosome-binding protein